MITIAVDGMGGDHAPDEIVRGVAEVSLAQQDLQLLLVGDEDRLTALLSQHRHAAERIAIQHAPDSIGMDEKPSEAVAAKPLASICVAAERVAAGEADALVSAGNTGAAVVACAKHFRRIPGVSRAALAAVYPTERRRGQKDDPFSLMLDVGATIDVTADDLVAFAYMGSAYSAAISRHGSPRVALLSNGTEAGKGPPEIVRAYGLLRKAPGLNFIGNIEGVDIPRGTADVVVCPGFVGNIVLKMLEGVSETVVGLARYASKQRLTWKLGLALLSGGIRQLKAVTDWQEYGGAPILGFDKPFIKAHGRSRARAVANAIKVAGKSVRAEVPKAIQLGLERHASEIGAAPR
jgi:glycerol-3-phosphate acyltransferase PlsX